MQTTQPTFAPRISVKDAANSAANLVQSWEPGSFTYVKTLQQAKRNYGRVQLMRWSRGEAQDNKDDGCLVAVKLMPTGWVRHGPDEHSRRFPRSSERPWCDLGILLEMSRRGCPDVCQLLGIFRDANMTYVVTSLATEGELLDWCRRVPAPGAVRETQMRPLAQQTLRAVQRLHMHGIAHGDLSLENILLTKGEHGLEVKLIDFGMACVGRTRQIGQFGKPSYQAPELHQQVTASSGICACWAPLVSIVSSRFYDAFLADAFALGVVFFTMAACEYPWSSTKRGRCRRFEHVRRHGFISFLQTHTRKDGSGQHLVHLFSEGLAELLAGLLELEPQHRVHLEEFPSRSVWELSWLQVKERDLDRARGSESDCGASDASTECCSSDDVRGCGHSIDGDGIGHSTTDLSEEAITTLDVMQ